MLSGHSRLFCPPELSLLAFDSVNDWIANESSTFSKDSVIRNLVIATGLEYDTCKMIVEDPGKLSIQQVYGLIQDYAGKRILVDKTPGYTRSLDTLERAEMMFENTRYIYLHRHPYPVIDSFVRNRLDKFLKVEDVDPYWYAEKFWATSNHNVMKLFESVAAERTF
ncbi:sulfotransferase, partial [candidate division KSB1 bacterium]|nr:sulfotransferase [candidate division KSB1 bacterium]NIS25213.1 sulfotransferase [candidate division KSB1 bacterium]NIT72121.1 sulfotransferase [candidate division KSB1 bacterium]NIU28675.1 sulfotransferase [candidate division KSB1 bacterium]NIU94432.1 hypothetical protein [candidate division KSB1 bacterium]